MINTAKLVNLRVYKALNMTFYTRFGQTKSTICQNGHIQMCPFLPIPLHFHIASAASDYVYIVHILIKRVRTLSLRRIAKVTVYGECTAIMPRSPNEEIPSRIANSMPYSPRQLSVHLIVVIYGEDVTTSVE